MKRNLGRKAVSAIEEDDDWRCFECEPDQIRVPRALFYSIYQYWVRERAKAEKRQERLNKKKSGDCSDDDDDPVMSLLNNAEQAANILKDYIKNEQGKWRRRRAAFPREKPPGGDSQTREEAVRHVSENLKKIIKVTNHNLKEVARIADKTVAEEIHAEDGGGGDDPGADGTSDIEDGTTANDVENGDVEMVEKEEAENSENVSSGKTREETWVDLSDRPRKFEVACLIVKNSQLHFHNHIYIYIHHRSFIK